MNNGLNIKELKKTSRIEVKPYTGKLPEGVILPEKLELANKLVKTIKI